MSRIDQSVSRDKTEPIQAVKPPAKPDVGSTRHHMPLKPATIGSEIARAAAFVVLLVVDSLKA